MMSKLETGDYIVNSEIIIERKSAEDFIQSLVSGRLFRQCARMVKSEFRTIFLLEGNPFKTNHQVTRRAIKGALLSVVVSWQIPVIYSVDQVNSAELIVMLAEQLLKTGKWVKYPGGRSQNLKNHRIRFLQGLPNTGPKRAFNLYEYFGSIQTVINADEKAWQQVEGIGKKTAEILRNFIKGE